VCNDNADIEYRCDGNGCGADAQQRTAVQYCSGDSASCTGSLEWQSWSNIQSCNTDQLCETNTTTYASCNTCPDGCASGSCCECSSGPCCDGCHRSPSNVVCQPNVDTEYRCEGNFCGANAQKRVADRYCSGTSTDCNGTTTWTNWQDIENCQDTQICASNTSTYAVCLDCPQGCTNGECIGGTDATVPIDAAGHHDASTTQPDASTTQPDGAMLDDSGQPINPNPPLTDPPNVRGSCSCNTLHTQSPPNLLFFFVVSSLFAALGLALRKRLIRKL
jgi:hypothetical protein